MKASLDTNVIIHLYRAEKQHILFDMFPDGVYVYEFILNVELEHWGKDILPIFRQDIEAGKVILETDETLRSKGLWGIFKEYYNDDKELYEVGDAGEVYAIALARVLGAVSVVTDDTKERGPHKTLMILPDNEVIPLTFYEILILLYCLGKINENEVIEIFDSVIEGSDSLTWNFTSKLNEFVRRFITRPYSEREKEWLITFCQTHKISLKNKIFKLKEKALN